MNNDTKHRLTSAYLQYQHEGMFALVDSVNNALSSIRPIVEYNILNNLTDSLSQIILTYNEVMASIDLEGIHSITTQLLAQFETLRLPTYDFSALADNITIEDDSVTLSDEAVETITTFLTETCEASAPNVDSQMSLKEFVLCVLLPVLLTLLPMFQADYHHRVNSLESQQQQLMQSEFQDELLELEMQRLEEEKLQTEEMRKQTEYIEQLLQILTNEFSETPEDTQVFPELVLPVPSQDQSLQLESAVVPDMSAESLADAGIVADVPVDHNVDE